MGHNPWDCPFRGASQPPFRVMLVPSDQQNLSTATNHFQQMELNKAQDLDYPSYEYFGDRQEHYSEGPYIDLPAMITNLTSRVRLRICP